MTTVSKLRPPCKIHGGKYYLAPWVVGNLPPGHERLVYVEPYCGMASVLLNKPRARAEALGDVDQGVVRIMRALRDRSDEYIARLRRLDYSEETFSWAKTGLATEPDDFEAAVMEYTVRRQSRGGMGKVFGWSARERGGKPGDVNAWLTMLDLLPAVAARLQHVQIHHQPALKVLDLYDEPGVLVYCDPPYLPATRTSPRAYAHEMNGDDHLALLTALQRFRGRVAISGYPAGLYDQMLAGWRRVEKRVANHSSQASVKAARVEVLWTNY